MAENECSRKRRSPTITSTFTRPVVTPSKGLFVLDLF